MNRFLFNRHGVWAIYRFEMARFARTLVQSVVTPVIATSLYFVVFGAATAPHRPHALTLGSHPVTLRSEVGDMAAVKVEELDEWVVRAWQDRAQQAGRTLEEELRRVLAEGALRPQHLKSYALFDSFPLPGGGNKVVLAAY